MSHHHGPHRPGAIVWREIAISDLQRTNDFYTTLLGWTFHDSPAGPDGVYRHFAVDGVDVAGGYLTTGPMAGVPTHWMHYISVADVDAATESATSAGARLLMGPLDIPHVGRASYLHDPQGAPVALFRGEDGDAPDRPRPWPVGWFCWESLITTDHDGSVGFYTRVAGHKVADFHGNTILAAGDRPEDGVADIGPAPPGSPTFWVSHLVVTDLDASRARAVELGAEVLVHEITVPEVGRMSFVRDPVGAVISLYQPERNA